MRHPLDSANGLRVQEVIAAAFESALKRKTVELPTSAGHRHFINQIYQTA